MTAKLTQLQNLVPNPNWATLPMFDRTGWRRMAFGDFAESIGVRAEPKDAQEEIYVGLEHLDPQCLHIRRWGKGSDVTGTKLRFRKGDIIFGRRRAYQRKLAVAEFDGICSAHAMVVRAKPELVLPKFLPFLMMSDRFMNRAVEISVGSLSPTINWKTLKLEEFDLPPLDQQRRIAEILWAVDLCASAYQRSEEMAEEASKIWITSTLDQLGSKEGHSAPNLGDIADIRTGKLDSNCSVEGGAYPFFTCDTRTLKIDTYSFDCEALLLAGNNAVGVYPLKHYKGKFDAYQRTYVITINDTRRITYPYLLAVLRHNLDELRRLSVGSATKFLTMRMLQPLKIPAPSLQEQQSVASRIRQFESYVAAAAENAMATRVVGTSLLENVS